jgi:hypothetical protein
MPSNPTRGSAEQVSFTINLTIANKTRWGS